jgi:hypothetical protein
MESGMGVLVMLRFQGGRDSSVSELRRCHSFRGPSIAAKFHKGCFIHSEYSSGRCTTGTQRASCASIVVCSAPFDKPVHIPRCIGQCLGPMEIELEADLCQYVRLHTDAGDDDVHLPVRSKK